MSAITSTPPDKTEAVEYYFTYISKVPAGDIRSILDAQTTESLALWQGISEDRSLLRYADGKWNIREVLSHINDTERLFTFRAFWFARALNLPLPSYDQDAAVAVAGATDRTFASHVDEFRAVRASTAAFFRNLPADAWMRRGEASGYPFSVRALAYIAAGHAIHHVKILRERYLTLP